MKKIVKSINAALLEAISEADNKAQRSVESAKTAINTALEDYAATGALIEKCRQMHKQDLFGFMKKIDISPEKTKRYLAVHDSWLKGRCELPDKRTLQKADILAQQALPLAIDAAPKPPPSVISSASTFTGRLNNILDRRPVNEWQQSERDQVKDVLQPVVDFYNSL